MDKKNVHPYLCVFNSISLCGDRTAFQAARPFLHSFTPNPLTDISNSWCKRCLLFPRALKSFCQHICKTFQDYSLEVNIFSFRPLHLQLRHPLNVLLGDVVVFSFLIWSWKNDWRKDTQLLLELKEHFLNPFFYTKTCYEQISIVEFKTAFLCFWWNYYYISFSTQSLALTVEDGASLFCSPSKTHKVSPPALLANLSSLLERFFKP